MKIKTILLLITLLPAIVNAQWVQTKGTEDKIIKSFAFSDSILFAATNRGVFLSIDNGTNWTIAGLSGSDISELAIDSTNIFAGKAWGFYHSNDNGNSWVTKYSGIANDGGLVVLGNNLFAGSYGGGVYRSTNEGVEWISVNNGLPHKNIYSLLAVGTNLFAGLIGAFSPWGVYFSSDYGQNWIPIWKTINEGRGYPVYSTAYSESNLFVGTHGFGVYRSTFNGTTWSEEKTGLDEGYIYSLVAFGKNIFASSFSKGIFLSTNNGQNWSEINEGLFNRNVYCLALSKTNLFAGTSGSGIFKRPLAELITDVKQQKFPSEYSLSQNYPNPFNPETTISYSIPASLNPPKGGTFVSLKVFDLLGREVVTLVDEYKQAGTYKVIFNVKTPYMASLPSGIYFYRLQAGSYSETKKLILMK